MADEAAAGSVSRWRLLPHLTPTHTYLMIYVELNVGTWISRMQPREYNLRPVGWVRTLSAVRSVLSVYLLALWALTYFGRPFE